MRWDHTSDSYLGICRMRGDAFNIHLVLTVERPGDMADD